MPGEVCVCGEALMGAKCYTPEVWAVEVAATCGECWCVCVAGGVGTGGE